MYRHLYLLFILAVLFTYSKTSAQSSYNIDVQLSNATSDTLYLAYFYGDAQYIRDTAYRSNGSQFKFQGDDLLPEGVYMFVMPPENSFFQVLIDKDQEFTIKADAQNITETTEIIGSEDNAIFYDYLQLIDQARKEKSQLQNELKSATNESEKALKENKLVELDRKVLQQQDKILKDYPNSLSALVIGASREPQIPELADASKEVRQLKAFQYYHKHYFDNIDLNKEAILRTPFIHQKVMDYFEKYTAQAPDSLIQAIDQFFGKLEENSTIYRYFLVKLLNKYANPTIVGQDAVYVHMAQQYYGRGKAPWVDEETLHKILDNAERFSYTLIGKKAPELELYDIYNQKSLNLQNIKASYKVLIFWSSTCNHCEKVMPTLPDIQTEINDSSVVIISVCTKADESCKKFVDNEKISDVGIHCYPVSAYGRTYDVRTTPKVFIMDADNKIASKGIGFNQIAQVIDMLKKDSQSDGIEDTSVN